MTRLSDVLAGGLLAAACSGVCADWSGAGQLGAVSANGNTKSQSANAKIELINTLDVWKHALGLNALYGKNDEVTSANRWDAAWQTDYKLTPKLFWFGSLRYEDDRYGAFDYQGTAATGLGYHFYDDNTTKLSAQLGVGYKRSRPQTLVKDADDDEVIDRIYGDSTQRAAVTGGVNFEHQLTATTRLINKFLVEATSDNTFAQNNLALQVSMSDQLALSVGYEARKNTSPPADQHGFDSVTTVNLVYKFK